MKQKLPKATNPGHAQTQEEGGMGGGVWVVIGKDAPPSSGVTKCGFSGAVPKGPQTYYSSEGTGRHWKGSSYSPDTTLALGTWGSGWMTASKPVKGHPDTMPKVL